LLSKIKEWPEPGSADSIDEAINPPLPYGKEVMGIVIAERVKNVRPFMGSA
jgi:hypothetical protein